ncbi:MAG TPA: DCC1-like thiol-disulfide oxidoreductase family protein [Terriglobales bacterium]|nr:DCC1-like thiol-disulfide oxidoreductase family protein [Terriglobales bacterium]
MISLASEMTDAKGRHARGWLFYDADCEFCTRLAARLARPIMRRGLALAPLQDPRVAILLGLSPEELLRAIRFVSSDAGQFSGANALLAIAREFWWARPLTWLSKLPGVMPALQAGYQWGTQRWRCGHVFDPGACL